MAVATRARDSLPRRRVNSALRRHNACIRRGGVVLVGCRVGFLAFAVAASGGVKDVWLERTNLRVFSVDTHFTMIKLSDLLQIAVGAKLDVYVETRDDLVASHSLCEESVVARAGVHCGAPRSWGGINLTAAFLRTAHCVGDAAGASSRDADRHRPVSAFEALRRRVLASREYRRADVVVCSFPAALCQFFMEPVPGRPGRWHLEKPMLIFPHWRFDHSRLADCDPQCTWVRQAAGLSANVNGPLTTRTAAIVGAPSVVVALDDLDAEYFRWYTGRPPSLIARGIAAIDWLLVGEETITLQWRGIQSEVLILPDRAYVTDSAEQGAILDMQRFLDKHWPGIRFVKARNVYADARGFYSPLDVLRHSAVVFYPYSLPSQTVVDYFWAGIRVFTPSVYMLFTLHRLLVNNGLSEGMLYEVCNPMEHCYAPGGQKSFDGHEHLAGLNMTELDYVPVSLPAALNACSFLSVTECWPLFKRWISRSWLYNTKHIVQFHSWADLAAKLNHHNAEGLEARRTRAAAQLSFVRGKLLRDQIRSVRLAFAALGVWRPNQIFPAETK